ncbi:hypothetical protein GGR52DRAFT_573632 [Hypoxylon sp. FL1284]|nr:hypothetical protein GGR52DRAFT_573632 [Hypoxylon sp. FL1284]
MVSIKSVFASVLAVAPFSSAYLSSLKAPETVKAGTTMRANMTATIYIQNWDDFGIVWGLAPVDMNCGDEVCVGQRIDYTPLFPKVPELGTFSTPVKVPDTITPGTYNLVAAIPYLVGASGLTAVQNHTTEIKVTAA